MQILNAKKSTILFKMDNGQVLQIPPRNVSSPFIGTKTLLMAVINSGTPKEIGIIVSSSYELDMMRQVGASLAYLHNSEREAREQMLADEPVSEPVNPVSVNIADAKNAELIESLQNRIRDLESQLEDENTSDQYDKLSKAHKVATDEIAKLRSQLMEAGAKQDELSSTITDKQKEVNELKDRITDLEVSLRDASKEVDVNKLPEVIDLKNQLKSAKEELEILRTNAENDTSELAAQVEQLTVELEAAKGASVPTITPEQQEAINKYPIALQENQKLGEENVQLKLKADRLEADLEASQKSLQQALTENDQLKADGKNLFEQYTALKAELEEVTKKYDAARAATVEIMNKFNIAFVDGQWVQTMNN